MFYQFSWKITLYHFYNKHHIISQIIFNYSYYNEEKEKLTNFINENERKYSLNLHPYLRFLKQTFSSILLHFPCFYETRWYTRNVSMWRVNATKLTWKLPISIYSHIQGLYMSLRVMVGIAIKCYVIINCNGR